MPKISRMFCRVDIKNRSCLTSCVFYLEYRTPVGNVFITELGHRYDLHHKQKKYIYIYIFVVVVVVVVGFFV